MSAQDRVRSGRWEDVDPRTLHDLVRLRVDVFVVEQACPYPELDGRDLEPGTLHLWTADSAGPTSYLRLLQEPDGERRIGRVATRADARGRGLARRLLTEALNRAGAATVVLDAQSHVAGFYTGFGFAPSGAEFVEDGIPHVPMRRVARPDAPASARGRVAGMTTDPRFEDPPVDPDTDRDPADQPVEEVTDEELTPYRELSEQDRAGEERTVVDPRADDPDVLAVEQDVEPSDDPGSLATDELLPGSDGDDGWTPPEDFVELEQGQTLDEKLAAEVPEPDPRQAGRLDADRDLLES